uniref:Ig-like domain-containing protein n=1 Tax=Rhodnius prolixus TaxID=13249 RepID=T1HUS4_RHOPR
MTRVMKKRVLVSQVPPTIMELSGGGTVEVRKGTPVTLECRAQGNPTPFYQWTRRTGASDLPSILELSTEHLNQVPDASMGLSLKDLTIMKCFAGCKKLDCSENRILKLGNSCRIMYDKEEKVYTPSYKNALAGEVAVKVNEVNLNRVPKHKGDFER